jgi:retinol dehydrogenase-12
VATLALATKQPKISFDEVGLHCLRSLQVFPRLGARVVIACRNINKGRLALAKLHAESASEKNNIRLMECDLSSFDSVRKFAALYSEQEKRLDVLICNAGLVYTPTIYTEDGWNNVMQSNYLGHFLLTHLLLDKLRTSRPSRIINVSSSAHRCNQNVNPREVRLMSFSL